ncbi:AAA family ATPase [Verminephrobacter aporrectodeae]|uniref:AAA family ATPase n=1 Tax=Verminephrobacter aporrectodeae TaxID=1110389 RepID=UPI002244EB2D|nr:AAA family ATPase [Verminephrobacter aporrectodeae]MCW8175346.1 ATPase [Verminephrobacter aporrectodeae subsp. tuberculatae]MCW8202828.1 ATPase [Verminephrobacter aporrectodeae subsp. tuberculatae]
MATSTMVPRIERLRVQNFRALKDIELRNITPLTVLLGPNGSGKSTLFDVFNFLSECFQSGLRQAWDRRGRGKELKTRGSEGPVVIELQYRERPKTPLITYHLSIDETSKGPVVAEEWLAWKRGQRGRPFRFLEYRSGAGSVISGEHPDEKDQRLEVPLRAPDLIAVNTLGQIAQHPRVAALRDFITDWYVSYLSVDSTRTQPESGPQDRLSKTGDNLPNVIQYLMESHRDQFDRIMQVLRARIPRLERIDASPMPDGRLLLQVKDAPFEQPVLSKFASDGTLKMLAYLTVLYDPTPPQFIGIEEPENFLHPRLLPELGEECHRAAERTQLLVTTHSPFFLNSCRPQEVRILYRDEQGFTQVRTASGIPGIANFMDAGASLGHLWMEGHFGMSDPLRNQGAPCSLVGTAPVAKRSRRSRRDSLTPDMFDTAPSAKRSRRGD